MQQQPDLWAHWKQPMANEQSYVTGLKLNNSLRQGCLVPFIPVEGKTVKFYYCGPTVYSHSHLGHARTYIYQDIIKRILRDHFHYDVFAVMNITDIDDKIIASANREKLDFLEFTKKWEKDFFDSMEALNVESPDVITRVSEFVPEIIDFVQKIIDNGYAYASNGSVYFDVAKYKSEGFTYPKLEPFSENDNTKLKEGEGASQENKETEKKDPRDFALWKNSKPDEPKWQSPWGEGRPGWHIECSAMAHCILGDRIDLHSGGIDLRFPHHDNSIAQAEAFLKSDQWINYFIHTGHLHIKDKKMSKSEKNFLTISEILQHYTGRQLRLNFALHRYDTVQSYSEDGLREAISKDKGFNEFFLSLRSAIRNSGLEGPQRWDKQEQSLYEYLLSVKGKVHEHLCNNLDFPEALKAVECLIAQTNIYLKSDNLKKPLLQTILHFVSSFMNLLGLNYDRKSDASDESVVSLMNVFSKFRDEIRKAGREKNISQIFKACDQVRDDDLVFLGIKLEDKAIGEPSVWKQSSKEELLQEREQKIKMQEKIDSERKKQEEIKKEKERQKLEQMKIPPQDLFKGNAEYSAFDQDGVPTHDACGKEISKKQQKVVKQAWENQKKLHEEYFKFQQQKSQYQNFEEKKE